MSERSLETIRIPRPIRYRDAYRAMRHRRIAVERGRATNALFLLEHQPVITLGRSSNEANLLRNREELLALGIEVTEIDRGGDVTYHGPGQLVAYPVLNLAYWRRSIRWYLRGLEDVLVRQLAGYGLAGERVEGLTGVWVNGAKVAAIGIGIHNWVTFHGVALNVSPDMNHFGLIIPCGIPDKPVTSLTELLTDAPNLDQAAIDFEATFRDYFEVDS
jgi:lipoyl(octanoyl) transferase